MTVTFFAASLLGSTTLAPPEPPPTRIDPVVDEYHGTSVTDNYRWLEGNAKEDPEVASWVRAQNDVTFDYLRSIPERDAIEKRLTELWDYEKLSPPFRHGRNYFIFRNDGLQNHSVLYTGTSLESPPRVLLDPNAWSEDGTVALGGTAFSEDGALLAYAVADAGSDWRTWRVLNVATGEPLSDELHWIKFAQPAWTPDNKGFFYSRYHEPREGAELQDVNKLQRLFYHRIGTPQSDDVLVFERPDQPDWFFDPIVSDDGRFLIIMVGQGTDDRHRIYLKDLQDPYAMPEHVLGDFDAAYAFIGNDGTQFYFRTTSDSPLGRVIAVDMTNPEPENWTELIPEGRDTLQSVNLVGNMLLCEYLEDAKSAVRLYDLRGTLVREVKLPGIGSAGGFEGKRTQTETFYSFSSFATPPSIFRYDLLTGESTQIAQAEVDFNPGAYVVKQVFYNSTDGARVPMFIAHKRGIELNGDNPTLLYGYGGFNISLTPSFSVTRLAWMELGGVFAMPNLRGGGEYGEEWHKAGTKANKQNVFDDFIAAAEWLIENDYTRPEKLAIQGGSNGGLLVGACMTQRPDLYGACLPAVGVMDMLRFHKFTIGWAWTDDYGSSDSPEEFAALRAYSPYHNIEEGVEYPATLVTTADTDDRVVPGHSFKFAAALQAAQAGDEPTLIRIETRAGHGAGKPTEKIIEEAADMWAFLVENLDMDIE